MSNPKLELLHENSVTARNFAALFAAFGGGATLIDTGGASVGIRFGTASAVWTAAVDSAVVTVAHGLGRTPVAIGAFTRDKLLGYPVTGRDATNFTVQGFVTSNVTTTATRTFDWIAIG